MKKRWHILVTLIVVGVAFFVFRFQASTQLYSNDTAEARSEYSAVSQRTTMPSLGEKRLLEMKAKLALAASLPPGDPVEDRTGWEEVPRELDDLLVDEANDEEAGRVYLNDAREFIENRHLEGTSVTDVTCGQSLCRVTLEHSSPEVFKEYQRHLVFSPWRGSNYFSGEPRDDGGFDSFLWLGREGFELPLEEIRARNATGKFSKR